LGITLLLEHGVVSEEQSTDDTKGDRVAEAKTEEVSALLPPDELGNI